MKESDYSFLCFISAVWLRQYYCFRSDFMVRRGEKELHKRINLHRVVHSPVLQIIPHSFYCFLLVIASIMLFKFSCRASDALPSYNYCQRKTKVTVSRYQLPGGWVLKTLFSFSHSFLVRFLTLCYNSICILFTGKCRQIIDRAV